MWYIQYSVARLVKLGIKKQVNENEIFRKQRLVGTNRIRPKNRRQNTIKYNTIQY